MLARVLDAFDRQTLAAARVERIVFDNPTGTTLATARNRALARTSAPLVLWFDGRHYPLPGLLEYCLDVHGTHRDAHTCLLTAVAPDASLRRDPLYAFLRGTGREAGPMTAGVYAWPQFRLHALSARRELFAKTPFDERFDAGEDLQLAARLIRSVPLTVLYEDLPQAVRLAPPNLDEALEREYRDGYFRQLRIAEDPRARTVDDVSDRFAFPERVIRPGGELTTLRATLAQLESTLDRVEPAIAVGDTADRLQTIYQVYEALFAHAAATGWLDAERGRPSAPQAMWRARANETVVARRAQADRPRTAKQARRPRRRAS